MLLIFFFFFVLLILKRYLVNVTPADGPTQRTHGEVQSEGSKIPRLSLAAGHSFPSLLLRLAALLPPFLFLSERLHVAFQSRLCGCGFTERGRKNPQGN